MTDKDTELTALKTSIDKLTDQLMSFSVRKTTRTTTTLRNSASNTGSGRRNTWTGCGSGNTMGRTQQNTGGTTILILPLMWGNL
eukprot:7638227-Ditylum_brightwellii.AAC.1